MIETRRDGLILLHTPNAKKKKINIVIDITRPDPNVNLEAQETQVIHSRDNERSTKPWVYMYQWTD